MIQEVSKLDKITVKFPSFIRGKDGQVLYNVEFNNSEVNA